MNETSIFVFTANELSYYDVEHPKYNVFYDVIGEVFCENENKEQDCGRIISLENVPMPMKDPSLPSIR